jgi:hypothetical protein
MELPRSETFSPKSNLRMLQNRRGREKLGRRYPSPTALEKEIEVSPPRYRVSADAVSYSPGGGVREGPGQRIYYARKGGESSIAGDEQAIPVYWRLSAS